LAPESDGEVRIARLLEALRTPTTSDGAPEQEAVSAIAATIAASPTRLTPGRPRMLTRIAAAKVAAVAAVVLLAGTGAAAATGSLPDPAQSVVSDALAKVHVDVPHPDDHAADAGAASDHSAGTAVGPDATGPAMKGLCTAWAARGKTDDSRGNSGNATSFSNLRQAAHAQDQLVKDYCADVLAAPDETSGPGQSAEDHGRSGEDHGRSAEDHGPPTSTPPSGVDQGTTASEGANQGGVGHSAPGATDGAANSGSHHPGNNG
jgi:hypothetical protein